MGLVNFFKNSELEEEKINVNLDNTGEDLSTFHEYQETIQKAVDDARTYSDEEIERVRAKLISTVTGNSYLSTTYEKEYPSIKDYDYPKKYKELVDKLKSASTMSELEKLKAESDSLKDELYNAYDLAKKGAIEELRQIESAGIVSRNKSKLALKLEKDCYDAELYQKNSEYIKRCDYVGKYEEITKRLQNATTINEIDNLKLEIRNLRDAMLKDVEQAKLEDPHIRNVQIKEEKNRIYSKLFQEDFELACEILGFNKDSNSAMKFKEKGKIDYGEMILVSDEELEELYAKRDLYLKNMITRAFFIKCLLIDVKKHNLSKEEKNDKYKAYLKNEFDYSEEFKEKVRNKLVDNYNKAGKKIPLWLLSGEEFDKAYATTYCVSYRIKTMIK